MKEEVKEPLKDFDIGELYIWSGEKYKVIGYWHKGIIISNECRKLWIGITCNGYIYESIRKKEKE